MANCSVPERSTSSARCVVFPAVGNEKYGGFMRKAVLSIAAIFAFCVIAAPAALAGTVSLTLTNSTPSQTLFTISGTYNSSITPLSIGGVQVSGPNDTFSVSFMLNTAASTNSGFAALPDQNSPGGNLGGLFDVNASMFISLNGGANVSLGTFLVEFDDTQFGNMGGLIFCFDDSGSCTSNAGFDIIGQTLFTGDLSNPSSVNFISTGNAQVNQVLSGYFNGTQFSQFGPTPEPSSIFLLGTGLLGIGFAMRRKLRLV